MDEVLRTLRHRRTSRTTLSASFPKATGSASGWPRRIIHNPPVLILDEPTSGLDPEQQRETRQLIASLSGDHTIILSTHILSEVEQSCSKVIIINDGRDRRGRFGGESAQPRQRRRDVLIEVAGRPSRKSAERLELVAGVAAWFARQPAGKAGRIRS